MLGTMTDAINLTDAITLKSWHLQCPSLAAQSIILALELVASPSVMFMAEPCACVLQSPMPKSPCTTTFYCDGQERCYST